jgi:hypothetical protein
MSLLKCTVCGKTINSDWNLEAGLRCRVMGCTGIMEFVGGYIVYDSSEKKLDLKCTECGSVSSSKVSNRKIGERCPIRGCTGRLDRYHG